MQSDVERNNLFALFLQRALQQGVYGTNPIHMGILIHNRLYGLHLSGKNCLRAYQVDSGQELVGCQYVAHVRAHLLAELRQDADDFATLFGFQFANLVVGLHHLCGLDEDRAS